MDRMFIRGVIAGFIALLMTIPTTAVASEVVTAEAEARQAEIAAFVESWTAAMLSEDLSRVTALPYGDAYAHWSPEDRTQAIEDLFTSLESNRPEGAAPIVDADEMAFVKGFLHGYVFDRETLEASGEDLQGQIEAAREAQEIEMDAGALAHNEEILETATPHADMLARQVALWASMGSDILPRAGDLIKLVPTLPSELDPVFEVVDPLLASAAGMSATGTYTIRVVSAGKETIISNVPLCTPMPLDVDRDGTTGPGGIDVNAMLCLAGTPEASLDLSEEGVLRAIATGAGPSLQIDRVDPADVGLPDFSPADSMLLEAYVPLENGKQMIRIGFDTTETGMPATARVTLIPAVEAWSGAPGALAALVDADEANADLRATADMVATAAGQQVPWNDIDALPGQAQQAADEQSAPARAAAAETLARLEGEAAVVQGTLEDLVAQLEDQTNSATAPVLAEAGARMAEIEAAATDAVATTQETAEATSNEVAEAAEPAVAIVDETVGFYNDLVMDQAEAAQNAVTPVAETVLGEVDAASRPARMLVDETVAFYTNIAQTRLEEAELALVEAKATTYATIVEANTQVGLIKNEYVWGDGATGQVPPLPVSLDVELPTAPETPFSDEPVDIAGAATASAESSGAGLAPRFGLSVESAGASGDLVVIAGFATREDTALPFENDSTLVLRFAPAPTLVSLLLEPLGGDSARLTAHATTPTTMSALLAMRSGNDVAAAGLVLGPLPTLLEITFAGASIDYEADANLDVLGFFVYDFASYADFVRFVDDGILTGGYSHAIAAELPTSFSLSYDEDAGTLVYTSAGGNLGGLDVATGRFVNDLLVGFWTHGRLTDLPTSFDLAAGANAASFQASSPIGAVEFERTNGPRLASPPPAFVVAYRKGAADLVHLKILGIQALGLVDERVSMDLAGGYPLVFSFVNGGSEVFGQFGSMPNHIEFATTREGERQNVDVTFLPAGFDLWAAFKSPSLGTDTAIVSVNDLAGRVLVSIVPSGPNLEWHASQITGGVFGGVHTGTEWKAAISLGQIPNHMTLGVDQTSQGFPTLAYSASHSTLDIAAYVGPQLLTGIGYVYLSLIDLPQNGLGFSVSGMNYNIWSKGPQRLTQWYMDVSGLSFSVSPISYHNRWVDNWILQVGADVEFQGTITVRHFYLLARDLASLSVSVTAPTLQVSVNGVLSMAFDVLMYTSGYANLYARALFGWICIICYYVSFNRAGEVPTYFHTWSYSWNVWRWNYISYPVGICGIGWGWISFRIEQRWVEVGLRLPAGFTTYAGGYSLSYGSANLFVNPGVLVPTELVYLYALATGFDYYFREYATQYCT